MVNLLVKKLELNGLGAPDEQPLTTVYHIKSKSNEASEEKERKTLSIAHSMVPKFDYCKKVNHQAEFCWWKPTGKNEPSAKRQRMEHNKNNKDTKQAAVQPKPQNSKESFN